MKFVVTAGPTREPIDPVRYISNRSSGKMGYAIAAAALEEGHDVTLISGPVCISPPEDARVVAITTADELHDAVVKATSDCDVLVMCAAVADYKPAHRCESKIKKSDRVLTLELTPTRDTLATIAREPRNFFVVGFAAETNDVEANALKKLRAKNCDLLVANDVSRSDSGIDSDQNEITIFSREGVIAHIARAEKKIIARELMKIVCDEVKKVLTKKS